MKFFISYNHSDQKIANALSSVFEAKGVDHFLDEKSIQPGDNIINEIPEKLNNSSHVIVIISPGSLKSVWVPFELGIAKANNLIVIPFLSHPEIDVPPYIAGLKYITELQELEAYIDRNYRGMLNVSVKIEAADWVVLGETERALVVCNENTKISESSDCYPALKIEVCNNSDKTIELLSPELNFKLPQGGIILGEKIVSCRLEQKKNLDPSATAIFSFYDDPSRKGKVMKGIIDSILSNNIESINLETEDKVAKALPLIEAGDVDTIRKYYQTRFPEYVA